MVCTPEGQCTNSPRFLRVMCHESLNRGKKSISAWNHLRVQQVIRKRGDTVTTSPLGGDERHPVRWKEVRQGVSSPLTFSLCFVGVSKRSINKQGEFRKGILKMRSGGQRGSWRELQAIGWEFNKLVAHFLWECLLAASLTAEKYKWWWLDVFGQKRPFSLCPARQLQRARGKSALIV